jgi:serine/threonine protein kinase
VAEGLPFGRYLIIKRLATGGMAEVFLARPRQRDLAPRLLVVKRMLPIFMSDPEVMRMFLDEARIASQLAHPYLIQIFDVGHAERALYVAMDYVHGVTVHDLMAAAQARGEAVPWALAVRLASYLCEALQYAHDVNGIDGVPLNLVHRDVTPTNVMISYTGAPKLVDFGIARASQRLTVTQPGTTKGKLLYAAPEQYTHGNVDARTDLYGVGVCLYEMLAGENPFAQTTTQREAVNAVVMQPPTPLHSRRRDVPKKLSRLIQQTLEKDPARRPATARDLRAHLEEALMDARAVVGMPELAQWVGKLFPGRAALVPAVEPLDPDAETIMAADAAPGAAGKHSTQPLGAEQRAAILASLDDSAPMAEAPPQSSPSLSGTAPGSSGLGRMRWALRVGLVMAAVGIAAFAAWGLRRVLAPSASSPSDASAAARP